MDSVGIVAVSLLLALLLIPVMVDNVTVNDPTGPTMFQLSQLVIWIMYIATVIRAVIAGASSISHDTYSVVWDELKVTGISERRFLLGKWWAAFYQMRGWIVALGIIRLALVCLWMVEYVIFMYRMILLPCYYEVTHHASSPRCAIEIGYRAFDYAGWQKWSPLFIPASVGSVVALTVFELMASTAVGIAAGLLLRHRSRAMLGGIFVRFLPIVTFSLWPNVYSSAYYIPASYIWAWRWLEYTWFSLADDGMTGVMRMAGLTGYFPADDRSVEGIPLALIAGFGMLILLFALSMITSWVILRLEGFNRAR